MNRSLSVLVTGFDPFGGETVNPSYEAVRLLPDTVSGAVLTKLEIPTSFEIGAERLLSAARTLSPDIVLCVGQAGGRQGVSLERVALNFRAAGIPDNSGVLARGERILPGAPDAYSAPFDLCALAERLRAQSPVFSVSYHAGTFVCNELYYRLLHYIAAETPDCLGLFVHVPYLPEQVRTPGTPCMELSAIRDALSRILEALIILRRS